MTAVDLKIKEWNANRKNFAFYKREGEMHSILKKEDFIVGFMNRIIEEKLKCIDNVASALRERSVIKSQDKEETRRILQEKYIQGEAEEPMTKNDFDNKFSVLLTL
ncbi:uncharacterized protein LOC143196195 [Rhynchophorus ferrugineus]|uniref:uncharacterized protein LOC143196195 n=1 Tax=Rhynchophorus ferrugineus TaxID=354439 RepID=UPI003FCE6CA3